MKKAKKLNFHGATQWASLGKYYGFPDCCIDEFVSFAVTGYPNRSKKRKFHGTGYVPCKHCDKHLSEQALADIINLRRTCTDDFPNRD